MEKEIILLTLLAEPEQASQTATAVGGVLNGGSFYSLIWLAVAVTVIYSGLLVMTQKDIVRAATALFVCLFGVSGLYLFLGAEFLAFVQIMVYVGGTTVLIMFGVMLTARNPVEISRGAASARIIPAIVAVALILVPLLAVVLGATGDGAPVWLVGGPDGSGTAGLANDTLAPQDTRNIGDMLLTSYILPFVVASFVLLIALVGASYIVRRREEPEDAEPSEDGALERA